MNSLRKFKLVGIATLVVSIIFLGGFQLGANSVPKNNTQASNLSFTKAELCDEVRNAGYFFINYPFRDNSANAFRNVLEINSAAMRALNPKSDLDLSDKSIFIRLSMNSESVARKVIGLPGFTYTDGSNDYENLKRAFKEAYAFCNIDDSEISRIK
jgi:hypothetical protein